MNSPSYERERRRLAHALIVHPRGTQRMLRPQMQRTPGPSLGGLAGGSRPVFGLGGGLGAAGRRGGGAGADIARALASIMAPAEQPSAIAPPPPAPPSAVDLAGPIPVADLIGVQPAPPAPVAADLTGAPPPPQAIPTADLTGMPPLVMGGIGGGPGGLSPLALALLRQRGGMMGV